MIVHMEMKTFTSIDQKIGDPVESIADPKKEDFRGFIGSTSVISCWVSNSLESLSHSLNVVVPEVRSQFLGRCRAVLFLIFILPGLDRHVNQSLEMELERILTGSTVTCFGILTSITAYPFPTAHPI